MRALVWSTVALAWAPGQARGEAGSPRELRITGGAFIGGTSFGRDVALGRARSADRTPGSAPAIGLRAAAVVAPDLLHGSELGPRLHLELEGRFAPAETRGDADAGRTSYFSPVFGWRALARLELWPDDVLRPFAVLGAGGETLISRSPYLASPDTDGTLLWGLGAEIDLNARAGLRVDLRQGLSAARARRVAASYEAHAGFFVRFGEPASPIERRIHVEGPPAGAEGQGGSRGGCGGDRPCPVATELAARPRTTSPNGSSAAPKGQLPVAGRADAPSGRQTAEPREGRAHAPAATAPRGEEPLERLAALADEVRFAAASAELDPASARVLDQMAAVLAENPSLRVKISGHTDATGTRSLNLMLSHARALQVVRYLVEHGIAPERLDAAGYGPDRPVDSNDTAEGRAKNRRIEIRRLGASEPENPGAP
jgi:outer membrane protein OmpA-like peptidoglycan-associated protein